MCVIAYVRDDKARPTAEVIRKMFNKNPHGAGIAWRRNATDNNGNELPPEKGKHQLEVYWEKGLGIERVTELAATVATPYVLHFRISSNDDRKNPAMELTHPFPISQKAETWMRGHTGGGVLFHNGHFSAWRSDLKQFLLQNRGKYPTDGRMSDTRAMAICCSYMGPGYMDLIEEKGIAFFPDRVHIFEGRTGWDNVDGMWVSNTGWTTGGAANLNDTGAYGRSNAWTSTTSSCPKCKYGTCQTDWGLDKDGYCRQHPGGKPPANPTSGANAPTTTPSTTGETNRVIDLTAQVGGPKQEQALQPRTQSPVDSKAGGSSAERGPFADAIMAIKGLEAAIAARNNGTGSQRQVKSNRRYMRQMQSRYRAFCEKNNYPLNPAALVDPELKTH